MTGTVKRNYASALRAEQARATRRAIVAAAARLFVERGYGETTVDAIAAAAGVSRKTVFTSVGSKVQALKLARDWAITGDDEPVAMLDRPQIKRAQAEPDARQLLRGYARLVREVSGRDAEIVTVIESAAGVDPEVRALADEGLAQRQTGMRAFAAQLARRGALRPGLTVSTAADILCVYNDARVYHLLVHARGWSAKRFEAWLADALGGQLIDPEYDSAQ
jgi:AcrR family transcriptional regulator